MPTVAFDNLVKRKDAPVSPFEAVENAQQGESSVPDIEEISSINIQGEIAASELGDVPENEVKPLPSVVFLISFPPPLVGSRSKNTTPFLMYSPPRRFYEKPAKNEEGKRPKEKLCKRLVRCFQKEVRMGEQLKRKEIPNEGKFRKMRKARGALIRGASTISKWLPASCVETLARLPPKHKLGEIIVLYPEYPGETPERGFDLPYQPTPEEIKHDLQVLLRKTKKGVVFRLVAVSCFLPIAAGIDFWAPVFFFEISVAYLAFQVYGLKKLKVLINHDKQNKKKIKKAQKAQKAIEGSPSETTEYAGRESEVISPELIEDSYFKPQVADQAIFDPIMTLLYNICARIDPLCFPPVESNQINQAESAVSSEQGSSSGRPQLLRRKTVPLPTLHKPGPEVVREMIKAFHEHLPAEVVERYNLDEEALSIDFARYLKKASVEYVNSLNDRPDSGMVKRYVKWRAKRQLLKRERKAKRVVKKQIKAEEEEEAAFQLAQAEENRQLNHQDEQQEAGETPEELNSREQKKIKKQLVQEEKLRQKEEKIRQKAEKSMNKKGKGPAVA